MLVEDGRNFVTRTSEKYDVISIEVGQIYRPRIASFYASEAVVTYIGIYR